MEGTPLMRGSFSTACRIARAAALKIPSMMWCVLRPWWQMTCKLNDPLDDTARQNSSANGALKVPSISVGTSAWIDGDCYECLIHRQGCAAVAANAGLVTQRLRQCLAQTNANILNRVMRVHVQIAGRLHGQIDQTMFGQQ